MAIQKAGLIPVSIAAVADAPAFSSDHPSVWVRIYLRGVGVGSFWSALIKNVE
jgi:hypothetical protein